jgi:hypothetical protein
VVRVVHNWVLLFFRLILREFLIEDLFDGSPFATTVDCRDPASGSFDGANETLLDAAELFFMDISGGGVGSVTPTDFVVVGIVVDIPTDFVAGFKMDCRTAAPFGVNPVVVAGVDVDDEAKGDVVEAVAVGVGVEEEALNGVVVEVPFEVFLKTFEADDIVEEVPLFVDVVEDVGVFVFIGVEAEEAFAIVPEEVVDGVAKVAVFVVYDDFGVVEE